MAATEKEFRDFVSAYITSALWSSVDNADDSGGEPLDKNYSQEDLTEEALAQIESECWGFVTLMCDDIDTLPRAPDGDSNYGWAGHLFWLNRCGHGTGFWDRKKEFGADVCDRLDEMSRKAGERDIYVGDDGALHYTFG